MSWLDRVNTDFVILCGGELSEDNNGTLAVGDGVQSFKPNWLNAQKRVEYNIAEFVFFGVKGSLVKRGTPKGTQYDIKICFQGASHIETATAFEKAAGYYNPVTGIAPPWRITHPYYGTLFVQPVSLQVDNDTFNVSYINANVIETVKDNGREFAPGDNPAAKMNSKAAAVNSGYVKGYVAGVPDVKITDIQAIRRNVNNAFTSVRATMNGVQSDIDSYLAVYNDINGLINNTIFDVQLMIMQVQTLLGMPAYFLDTLSNRMRMFMVQAEILNREHERAAALPQRTARSLHILYETSMAAVITGMSMATINNITNDYNYRPNVLDFVNTVVNTWNTFLINLCANQSGNGGMQNGWLPNASNLSQLNILVNQTVSYLFTVAGRAKQQRIKTLVYDSNLVLLAHELYGMKPDDSTIITLKANNNFGLNTRWRIPAGTNVIYYV